MKYTPVRTPGGSHDRSVVGVKAGPGFAGYEVSLYVVRPRTGGGVRVVFRSAEIHKSGKITLSRHTIKPLFRLPKEARYVRILHWIGYAPVSHGAAILAADNLASLDALTQRVQLSKAACRIGRNALCMWVPQGIAVVPEAQRIVGAKMRWAPMF